MPTPALQRTILHPRTVRGFGYWFGRDIAVTFRPAPADAGIVFMRTDLPGRPCIPARLEHRVEAPRRTVLSRGGVRVEMVEHVLAALVGLRIDNCLIEVDGAEMPGCDGSSRAYTEALVSAGFLVQEHPRTELVVRDALRIGNDEAWIEAAPTLPGGGGMSVEYRIDYGEAWPMLRQTFSSEITVESFVRELAGCRTFLLREEADWLQSQGLGCHAGPADLLVFDAAGPVDNHLRFDNECARHKALDLMGDLALLGSPVIGRITCHRGGHRLHAQLAHALAQHEGASTWKQRKSA